MSDRYIGTGNYLVEESTHNNYIVLGIVVAFLVVVILIFITFYVQINTPMDTVRPIAKSVPLSIIETVGTTVGSTSNGWYKSPSDAYNFTTATACQATGRSEWNTTTHTCVCTKPYWGPSCERDSYDSRYMSAGVYDPSVVTIIDPAFVSPLTGGLYQCTDTCLDTFGCSGVIYRPNEPPGTQCTMFYQLNVTPGKSIPYPLGVNEEIYIQNTHITDLVHTDRVFLFSGTLPIRHWLSQRSLYTSPQSNEIIAWSGVVYQLPFFSTGCINGGNLTGVYSLDPFTPSDYDTLLNNPTSRVYIHYPSQPLSIPLLWSQNQIWVEYRLP